ncbi:TetR/AcrR family transcriptional regulator [Rhodococcus sp. NPDC058521]|uniref:TetR/AcrR family transcriptional regulator n=1 Tax=Rhodococcus sp. NPDC058521 TaxID=3346536 RepID=UPI0036619765
MARTDRRDGLSGRQTALLDNLVELFLTEGFAHLTLDDMASAVRCSKTTLYALAEGKDELVRVVAITFFRRAAEAVEESQAGIADPAEKITGYLSAVGDRLGSASAQFMNDLATTPAGRDVYAQNTRIAAERVRELIDDGVGSGKFRSVHADFVADVTASTMTRIQQRDVARSTGLDDAQAYRELAALITAGLKC